MLLVGAVTRAAGVMRDDAPRPPPRRDAPIGGVAPVNRGWFASIREKENRLSPGDRSPYSPSTRERTRPTRHGGERRATEGCA